MVRRIILQNKCLCLIKNEVSSIYIFLKYENNLGSQCVNFSCLDTWHKALAYAGIAFGDNTLLHVAKNMGVNIVMYRS